MLSFDYAPTLLKGIIDQELKRYVVGCSAAVYEQNLQTTEYIGREGLAMWGTAMWRCGTSWRDALKCPHQLVAGLAEAHLLRVAPHFYREYDVHLAAAQPNLVAIESFDWLSDLLESPFEVRDGLAIVPERPGFGVNFRSEAIREFRFQG